METYYGYRTRRYGTTVDGHDVEITVDKRRVIVNRIVLSVDGVATDEKRVSFGQQSLFGPLRDGSEVHVNVELGGVGGLRTARVRSDRRWIELDERR
ncbi:MAG: hypothetical protein ACFCVG_15510 [Kineosporiaceae bacterium]